MTPTVNEDRKCFFCRSDDNTIKAGEQHVEWHETHSYVDNPNGEGIIRLYLHADCAVQLGLRLIGDGCEAGQTRFTQEQILFHTKHRTNQGGRWHPPWMNP